MSGASSEEVDFGRDLRLMGEVTVTGDKVGAGRCFWAALAHNEERFRKVVAFVAEMLRVVFNLVSAISRDMTDWTCVEPAPAEEGEFEPVLQEFLRVGEPYVDDEEMVKRAKEQGALTGLRHAESMLRNQDKISAEWRKYVLIFSEVWVDPHGNRHVFCLDWDGERWVLHSHWLGHDFSSDYRLVASRKYPTK